MRVHERQEGFRPRQACSSLLILFFCLWLVPVFVGATPDGEESGRIWLRRPFRAMSGSSSSTDPAKSILRSARPEKRVQSRIAILPPRAGLFVLPSNGNGFGEDEREDLLPQLIAYRLPIKRAPPLVSGNIAFDGEFVSSRL